MILNSPDRARVIMLKELILLIFLIGCVSISDAKLPQKGDYVYILVSTTGEEMGYWGTITDINQNFVLPKLYLL
jgi:hypothetical protein